MNSVEYYNSKGYRTLEIPLNTTNPKALVRKGWDHEPTNRNISSDRLFAVIQEGQNLVIDIDDISLNGLLENYLNKTLVTKTGNGGRHYYFKDKSRVEKYTIKSTPLYKNGKHVGDIKADMSYVIGYGRSYKDPKDHKIKSYDKISSVDQILELDVYEILKILTNAGITKTKSSDRKIDSTINTQLTNGLVVGERNNELFKTSCDFLEKNISKENVRVMLIEINNASPKPLPESEIDSVLNSADKRITNKKQQEKLSSKEIVEFVAKQIMEEKEFVTISRTNEILTWDGKIYSQANAVAYIKSKTEQLVYDNTEHISNEVVNKIKRRTYKDIEEFDINPNEITTLDGVLNLETLAVTPHSPDNLNLILVPLAYSEPKFPIIDKTIFEDIEKNLENTLFWKFITSSFTVKEKLQEKKRETVLEILASIFIKHQIDQRGFIFLGRGDNGKSVFIEYLQMMLGKENYSNETLHDLSTDRFASASLLGKLLNCFSDIESNELDRVGILKAILAGEWISAQFKNGQKFKFNPFCKMVFSCNRFPRVSDNTESFFRRWIIVKWERSFEGDPQRDEKLVEKLSSNQEELNLVFSTIVHLSRKLYQTRKFTNTKKASELRTEWNQNADPVETFIDTWIIPTDDTKDEKGIRDTYSIYKEKTEELGERPLNIRQFGREFAESFDQLNTNGKRRWVGLKFKETIDDHLGVTS